MKIINILYKDLLHFLHSPFTWAMMLAAPLIIPTIIYMAFGNMNSEGFDLPVVQVVVANQDQPDPQSRWSASQLLVEYLQSPEVADLLSVTGATNEAEARLAVQKRIADVAVIIPANFTAAAMKPDESAEILLLNEPSLAIAPEIVESLVGGFIDGLSGAKIAVGVVLQQAEELGVEMSEATSMEVAERYISWVEASSHSHSGEQVTPLVQLESPSGGSAASRASGIIGPVMAGMIVFFVFFTGANSASMIIQEEEEGTLSRLYTTPTGMATILGGKFVTVLVMLAIQSLILLTAARLIFGIHWGEPATVVLVMLALIIAASGFGIFLMSFIRTSRQAGIVQGGVMTIMGLAGGLFTAFVSDTPAVMNTIALLTPQGWALRSLKLALAGASYNDVLMPVATLLAMGLVFYLVSTLIFRRRFA